MKSGSGAGFAAGKPLISGILGMSGIPQKLGPVGGMLTSGLGMMGGAMGGPTGMDTTMGGLTPPGDLAIPDASVITGMGGAPGMGAQFGGMGTFGGVDPSLMPTDMMMGMPGQMSPMMEGAPYLQDPIGSLEIQPSPTLAPPQPPAGEFKSILPPEMMDRINALPGGSSFEVQSPTELLGPRGDTSILDAMQNSMISGMDRYNSLVGGGPTPSAAAANPAVKPPPAYGPQPSLDLAQAASQQMPGGAPNPQQSQMPLSSSSAPTSAPPPIANQPQGNLSTRGSTYTDEAMRSAQDTQDELAAATKQQLNTDNVSASTTQGSPVDDVVKKYLDYNMKMAKMGAIAGVGGGILKMAGAAMKPGQFQGRQASSRRKLKGRNRMVGASERSRRQLLQGGQQRGAVERFQAGTGPRNTGTLNVASGLPITQRGRKV